MWMDSQSPIGGGVADSALIKFNLILSALEIRSFYIKHYINSSVYFRLLLITL